MATILLPYCATIFPEKGIASNCPMGNAKSIVPNSASLKFRKDLISGILLAQLEKQKPIPKKNRDVAHLTRTKKENFISLKGFLNFGLDKIFSK